MTDKKKVKVKTEYVQIKKDVITLDENDIVEYLRLKRVITGKTRVTGLQIFFKTPADRDLGHNEKVDISIDDPIHVHLSQEVGSVPPPSDQEDPE